SISTGTVTLTLTTSGTCAAATSTVVITVNATSTANAGSPQSVCQGGAVTLAGSIGGSATGSTWSAPSGSFSDVNLLNSTYTPSITTGTVTLTLTTSGPCAAATSTVVITVNATSTANAGSPQTVCQGGTVTLAGSRGGSATGSTWSAPSGSFSSATSLTSNYTPSITTGTVTLTLTTSGPCAAATSTVVITVNPTATANAGSPQTVCQGGTVTLAGTRGGSATGSTCSASSGSFSVASSLTSQYTPSITTGSITLTLTTSGPCAPVTSTVVITVNPNATANAGSSQSVCLGGTLTLAGTINGSATGSTWSAPSGSFSNTSSLTSTYTPSITSGNITLTLTTSGPCAPATSTMVVSIDPPALVNAGISTTICKGTPYTLTGSSIGGSATTGTWSITASTGTMTTSSSQLSSTSPTANPSSIVFSPNGNNTGTVTLTLTTNKPAGPCNAVASSIIITISNAPTSNAGSNTTICSGSGYALAGSNIGGAATTGTWSISAVTGTMTNASSQLSNLAPTNTPSSVIFTPISTNSGTVTLTLTTDDPAGPCPAATNTVVLTVDLAPTVNAGSPNTLCSGNPYSLSGSNIGGGASTGVWSITGVTGTMTNAASQLSNITPTATPSSVIFTPIASNSGTVTLTLSTNDPSGQCGIVGSSVTLTVNPAATVNAGIPATVCAGIAYPLTGSGIGGGATTGTWSITAVTGTMTTAASQLSNTAATAAPSLVTFTAALLNSGTVTLTLTTDDPTGPCNSVSTTLSLTINPAPPKPVFDASNPVSVCYNQQGVNYAITALPNTNYLWSSTDPSVRFYGKRTPNCLIDFPSSGSPFKIYVTAINPTTGCRDSSFVNLSTTGITPTFAKVIATNNNKTLVCLDNSQSTFQWGFDNTTFIGTDVTGATLQDFTPLGGIDPTK
ncbi:MAG: hypothetical protein NTW54_00350, partial [Bacteroidetes bacterium]|nr:hypothetical protein [Bacteroidota bacterium]